MVDHLGDLDVLDCDPGQIRHRDLVLVDPTEFRILDHVTQFKNGILFNLVIRQTSGLWSMAKLFTKEVALVPGRTLIFHGYAITNTCTGTCKPQCCLPFDRLRKII